MVKGGCWGEDHCQLHRFFAWKDVNMHANAPFSIDAADCHASETRIAGSIKITEEEASVHPEWMCDAEAFAMYWHAEGMKSAFSGTIMLNDRKYTVTPDTCYGYADKNWGRDFTSPWVWLSSNHLVSKKTVKQLPFPGSVSTWIVPPCRFTTLRTIASPSPFPCVLWLVSP